MHTACSVYHFQLQYFRIDVVADCDVCFAWTKRPRFLWTSRVQGPRAIFGLRLRRVGATTSGIRHSKSNVGWLQWQQRQSTGPWLYTKTQLVFLFHSIELENLTRAEKPVFSFRACTVVGLYRCARCFVTFILLNFLAGCPSRRSPCAAMYYYYYCTYCIRACLLDLRR